MRVFHRKGERERERTLRGTSSGAAWCMGVGLFTVVCMLNAACCFLLYFSIFNDVIDTQVIDYTPAVYSNIFHRSCCRQRFIFIVQQCGWCCPLPWDKGIHCCLHVGRLLFRLFLYVQLHFKPTCAYIACFILKYVSQIRGVVSTCHFHRTAVSCESCSGRWMTGGRQ